MGLCSIFDRPDSLTFLDYERLSNIFYWDVVTPVPTRPMAFLFFIQSRRDETENYLRTSVPRGVRVFQSFSRRWWPNPPRLPDLDRLVNQALLQRRTLHRRFEIGHRLFLATAYPTTQLGGCCTLTLADLRPLQAQVRQRWNTLAAGAVLLVAGAGLFALLLSGYLLQPIRHLTAGVAALEQRQFSFRLPEQGKDEFGALAATFNRILAEMSDLDIAREVQMRLIPKNPPTVAGYEVYLHSQSASDLGGDYCDAILTPSGHLVLLTGDVTGHGIGSALVGAMAKTVCHLSAAEDLPVPGFLRRLNRPLFKLFQRKKLLSLVMARLDPATHTLEWTCAGHPFPLVRKPDGSTEFLRLISFPLGSTADTKAKTQSRVMQPGEALLFYTDGIVEIPAPNGEMFGYHGVEKVFGTGPAESAAGLGRQLLSAMVRHSGPIVPPDDVTLLILRRKPC
jgi:HAMP domain-containing protein